MLQLLRATRQHCTGQFRMNPCRRIPSILFCLLLCASGQQSVSQTHGELLQRPPEQQKQKRRLTFKVIVKDSSGHTVPGLSMSAFNLNDSNRSQPITRFDEVQSDTRPPDRVILLLDTMNNTFDNVAFERKGITEFLKGNGGHLAHPTSLIVLSDYGVQVGKPSLDGNVLVNDLRKVPTPIRENAGAEGAEGLVRRFQSSIRAITRLVTYEATVPGRSTLIWFGPGWPMLAGSRVSISSDADRRGYFSAIVDLTNRLREAGITLDNIAPSALISGSTQRQDYYKVFMGPVLSERQSDSGNLALPVLALHSGGQVLQQGSTLPQEIATCVEDADRYYLLTVDAAPPEHPYTYHPIIVTLANAGLSARTSAGYYSEP